LANISKLTVCLGALGGLAFHDATANRSRARCRNKVDHALGDTGSLLLNDRFRWLAERFLDKFSSALNRPDSARLVHVCLFELLYHDNALRSSIPGVNLVLSVALTIQCPVHTDSVLCLLVRYPQVLISKVKLIGGSITVSAVRLPLTDIGGDIG